MLVKMPRAIFSSYFVQCLDIGADAVLMECARRADLDWTKFRDARPLAKQLLRENVDESLRKGVFGSPFFMVDGEPFFGVEKLAVVEQWLATGGW